MIDANARIIGDVYGVEFDPTTWSITHICVNLTDVAIDALGYPHPHFLGRILVDLPTNIIHSVHDVVTLNTTIEQVKSKITRHK